VWDSPGFDPLAELDPACIVFFPSLITLIDTRGDRLATCDIGTLSVVRLVGIVDNRNTMSTPSPGDLVLEPSRQSSRGLRLYNINLQSMKLYIDETVHLAELCTPTVCKSVHMPGWSLEFWY